MRNFFILCLAATLGTIACDRSERREAAQEAREESREAGRAVERGAEDVASRLPDDDRLDPTTKDHEQYVGTVTRLTPGQTLSIETASGDNQSFDLKETGTTVNMPSGLKKGAKVTVTVDRNGNKKTISVTQG